MEKRKQLVAHVLFDEDENPIDEQPLSCHLTGTSEKAAAMARVFGAEEWGKAAGLLHDVGKASEPGQKRMRDPFHTPKCDHSSLGAQLAWQQRNLPLAFAVAGHHGRLPDGGAHNVSIEGTLMARMKKALPDASAFVDSWSVPLPPLVSLSKLLRPYAKADDLPYALSFFTRMLHSCLVDADYLDTEGFLNPKQMPRGGFLAPGELELRLKAYMKRFGGLTGVLQETRAQILAACLQSAELDPGFFSLTVPTGGGKTLASLSFALRHAVSRGKNRVIYAIPYTSILEQTADRFSEALGAEQVVAHYADAFQNDREDDWEDDALHRKHLAAENWDAPVIVTTNVQLFESLYAAQPGRCRKLHNLANSVIVLDEAQLLPTPYLLPCLRALGELVRNYGTTVVLMSATQPELGQFLPENLPVREIIRDIPKLYTTLKRVTIRREPKPLTAIGLAERLAQEEQTICIIATRKRAREIYELLPEQGRYHLSTLMLPDDRRRVLNAVREALERGETCRLVSTSLVEAGVDVDFPSGWREVCGLDSILQAAGRVNREGRKSAEESILHVFTLEDTQLFSDLPQRADVAKLVFHDFEDVTSPDAISMYFDRLYHFKGADALDSKRILERLERRDGLYPFREISDMFHLIEDDTVSVVIPAADETGERLRRRLNSGSLDKELMRAAGASSLQLRRREAEKLYLSSGIFSKVTDDMYLLIDASRYDPNLGLDLTLVSGLGLFV